MAFDAVQIVVLIVDNRALGGSALVSLEAETPVNFTIVERIGDERFTDVIPFGFSWNTERQAFSVGNQFFVPFSAVLLRAIIEKLSIIIHSPGSPAGICIVDADLGFVHVVPPVVLFGGPGNGVVLFQEFVIAPIVFVRLPPLSLSEEVDVWTSILRTDTIAVSALRITRVDVVSDDRSVYGHNGSLTVGNIDATVAGFLLARIANGNGLTLTR